jgi:3-methyladenine DNA glycosylase AlkD
MPDPTPDANTVLAQLRALARPDAVAGMARFGMNPEGRLGISVPVLRATARGLGRDHVLALSLWDSGVPEAQIVAALVAEPARFTVAQMNHWVTRMRAWDTCDQACTNAFAPSPLAWGRVPVWAGRRPEFEKRAAFALLAALAVHDKRAGDEAFVACLPLIEAAADDERNFVRKAVNWALRQIGKRNGALLGEAVLCAERLRLRPSKAARWIAADALREWRGRQPD